MDTERVAQIVPWEKGFKSYVTGDHYAAKTVFFDRCKNY